MSTIILLLHGGRGKVINYFFLPLLILILLISNPVLAATTIINNNGGACPFYGANGGSKIFVGDTSQFQLQRCNAAGTTSNVGQYFKSDTVPTASQVYNSIFLRVGSTVYGAHNDPSWANAIPFTSVSNTGGSTLGDGVTTTVYQAIQGGLTYTITQTVTYFYPNDFYTVKLDVNVPAGNTEFVRLYSWTDIMLDGDDRGTCARYTAFPEYIVADNTAATVFVGYRQRSLSNHWNRYYCGPFAYPVHSSSTMITTTGTGDLDNSIDPTNTDVGAAVQWDIGAVANTTFSAEYDFLFSVNAATLTKHYGLLDSDPDHTMSVGETVPMTFTITNRPGTPAQSAMSFTETLPAGVTIVGTPTASQCNGTVTKGSSGGRDTLSFSGGIMTGGTESCAITLDVTSNTVGVYADPALNISGITNLNNIADATLTVSATLDYSDAPSSYGTPSHQISPSIYLGTTAPDSESTANPTANADGDNTTGTNDEEGITLPTLRQGKLVEFNVNVTGTGGYLQAWIDWNGDGDFNDTVGGRSEQIALNYQDGVLISTHGSQGDLDQAVNNIIRFQVLPPVGATTSPTYARFRWSSQKDLNATDSAPDGEVEDYLVTIQPSSFPTYGAGTQAACTVANQQQILLDSEFDQVDGSGGWLNWTVTSNPTNAIYPWLSNQRAGYASVWLDKGESILSQSTLGKWNKGPSSYGGAKLELNLFWADASNGTLGTLSLSRAVTLEVRIGTTIYATLVTSPGYDFNQQAVITYLNGATGNLTSMPTSGESVNVRDTGIPASWIIELPNTVPAAGDFNLRLNAEPSSAANGDDILIASASAWTCAEDFSDAPASYGTPSHMTNGTHYMGTTAPDGELAANPSVEANGDDTTGTADEEGVTLPPMWLGAQTQLSVKVNGAGGYLQAWFDWNGDGDFADAGEQVATNLQDATSASLNDLNAAAGVIDFVVTPPANATLNKTYARFRWSTTQNVTPTDNMVVDGEVEDYALTLQPLPAQVCNNTAWYASRMTSTDAVNLYEMTFTGGVSAITHVPPPVGRPTTPLAYTNLAYREADGYFYGTALNGNGTGTFNTAPTIVKIGSNDIRTAIGWPVGLSNLVSLPSATFGSDGYLYINNQTGTVYKIDVTTSPPSIVHQTTPTVAIGGPQDMVIVNDTTGTPKWAYGFYTEGAAPTGSGVLARIDITQTTGTWQVLGSIPAEGGRVALGAFYQDNTGAMYAVHNGTGNVYRVVISGEDTATPAATFTRVASPATLFAVNNNDGAFCPSQTFPVVVATDYSDAPATYGTPSHGIATGMYLGTTVPDAEAGAIPTTNADGDNTDGTNDEDGVTLPISFVSGQTVSITIAATGTNGYLQGWVDWNGDGDFADSGEQVITNLADNATGDTDTNGGTIKVDVPVPANATAGTSYVRFRWSSTKDLNATSTALDGEVEDYAIQIASSYSVAGIVFEDINYGGGAGRDQATASGVGVNGVTVELYNSTGTLVATTTTANDSTQDGAYRFNNLLSGDYYVRVVNETVNSTRTGSNGTELGVQTFRTNGTTPVTNEVGGHAPKTVDGTVNSGTETLDTAIYQLSNGGRVQSLQPVTISTADITGVSFGFNFDTIVNTNDSGQGSLHQFIINSNLLANTGLAQALPSAISGDYTSGDEVSIFMVPKANLSKEGLNMNTVFIQFYTALPAITDSATKIDGRTQTLNIEDSNVGQVGTGGTVGVDNLTLAKIDRPEVVLDMEEIARLQFNAAQGAVRGIAIYDCTASATGCIISLNGADGLILEHNIIGAYSDSSIPTINDYSNTMGVYIRGQAIIRNNYFAFNQQYHLMVGAGEPTEGADSASNTIVENNEFHQLVQGVFYADAIAMYDDGITVQGNLIDGVTDGGLANNAAGGRAIEMGYNSNTGTIRNNSITGTRNGGIAIGDASVGHIIERNKVYNNGGSGVLIYSGVQASISQNSFWNNQSLGIDLYAGGALSYGDNVTLNDANDADTGGNGLLNFPIVSVANVSGTNLIISGCAPSGSTIELFEADVSPTSVAGVTVGSNALGKTKDYGEGERYVQTFTEGVDEDVVATPVNCATLTDTDGNSSVGLSPFQWTVPIPANVVPNDLITATATVSGVTSEFSPVKIVNQLPVITSDGGGATATLSVAENQTAVTTVIATDADPTDVLTYSIGGGADAALFAINSSTGVLTFLTAPDYEVPTDVGANNVYDVQVTVSDGKGGSDVQDIAITVTDVAENIAPTITSDGGGTNAALSVAENQTAVTTVTATDANTTDVLTYSISGGADAAKFAIDSSTGVLAFITAPDYEVPTDAGADNSYDVQVTVIDGQGGTDVQDIAIIVTDVAEVTGVILNVKGFLQGPYDSDLHIMRDLLRTKNLIPSTQPYTVEPFLYAGAEIADPILITVADNNAIVDWVLVELYDSTTPTTLITRKAVLLQRDGDVVTADTGSTNLNFMSAPAGDYYVALRHRNHLGVMTAVPVTLSTTPTLVDFTLSATLTYGTHARLESGTTAVMWAGNANMDNQIIANGPNNDSSPVLGNTLSAEGNTLFNTNYRLAGYKATDLDLNGETLFAGPDNDTNILLGNVLLHPANSTFSANYVIRGGMPQLP